jgi:hypothetical protein
MVLFAFPAFSPISFGFIHLGNYSAADLAVSQVAGKTVRRKPLFKMSWFAVRAF